MKKYITIILCIAIFSGQVYGQEFSSLKPEQFRKDANYGWFSYVQPMFHSGMHPSGTNYLQDIFAGGFKALELRVGFQSTGRQMWQQLHNYPQYGLGFYLGDLGGKSADSLIGTPSALFFYFGAPWARFGRFTVNTDLSIGLGYDFEPYDPETNPYQDVIGSRVNVYFNLNFLLYYRISNRLDISLGYALTHFSNGRMYTPQMGVNTLGFNLGLKYNFNPVRNYTRDADPDFKPNIRPEFYQNEKPEFKPHHEIQLMGAIGTVLTERPIGDPKGIRYMTSSITGDYAYRFARKMYVSGGLDILYDGSLAETYEGVPFDEVTFFQKMEFATHIGYQYLIERFTFLFNIAVYVYKETPARGSFFMRAGGRIALTDKWGVHICLKTMNGGVSDWVEWGAVYKIRFKDK